MRVLALLAAVLTGILAVCLLAQQPLDNQAIVKLHNAGISDETILHVISTEPGRYATGVSDIIALKQAGVSEKVIRALVNKANPAPAPPPTPVAGGPTTIPVTGTPQAAAPAAATPPPAAPVATPPPTVTGVTVQQSFVYYAKEHQWVPLPAETVSWKPGGGKFKAVASAGMVKREINGVVSGLSSKTTVKAPTFLLYAPQNIAVTQYSLVRMRPHGSDSREFLGVRQEDFDFRATRDTVAFESKEVESHWFRVTLPPMEPGEYGFVPPEVAASDHSPDEPGKVYTFHLTD